MNGHAKGGHARAAALSPETRSEIARTAAQARWSGEPSSRTPSRRALLVKMKRHRDAIAKHRDELRAVLQELEAITESADDAVESLDYAINRLSEYL